MKVMFSAGEASGDTHAASVANALKEIDPSVDMFGMGGTLMERAGVRIVYDIKNLKQKFENGAEPRRNSPWNIAADFLVDMSFSAKEIEGMLNEYESDYHTGMNTEISAN